MSFVLGLLAGLVWGALAALLNGFISKKCVEKNTASAMSAANIAKIVIDIGSLAVVLLLKPYLPFSFEGAIIGTVIALSMLTILISYHIARS